MAITVNSVPDAYSPVYNPIGYNIESNNSTQTNFNFICDVYINSAVTLTARLKFPVYPSTNDGYIDVSGVLKNYLTSNVFTPGETTFNKCGNTILRYDIQWGEQYGPSSGITTYPNLTSSTGYAFAGSLQHLNLGNPTTIVDWVNWNSSTYTYLNQITYLTNAPRTGINIRLGEDYALYFFNTATNYAYEARVVYYNSTGSIISTQTISNSHNTVGLYDTRFLRIACGLANVTEPANTSYYLVYLYDNLGAATSEGFRFNIDSSCSKAERNYRFVFKNALGGFDAFTFMGQFERSVDIKKDFYKSIGATYNGSNYLVYSIGDRAEKQYNTVTNESFKCHSGWITQEESDWLRELVESPEVYIYNPSISLLSSVNITDTSYTYKTTSRDQLFNLELTFKPTFNSVRQQF